MDELFADEAELRDMLERALVSEPPLGSVVRRAVRAGCDGGAGNGWRGPWPAWLWSRRSLLLFRR